MQVEYFQYGAVPQNFNMLGAKGGIAPGAIFESDLTNRLAPLNI
jgi:hypothetical protein